MNRLLGGNLLILVFVLCLVVLALARELCLLPALAHLARRWRVRRPIAAATFSALGTALPALICSWVACGSQSYRRYESTIAILLGGQLVAALVIPIVCVLGSKDRFVAFRTWPLVRVASCNLAVLLCVLLPDLLEIEFTSFAWLPVRRLSAAVMMLLYAAYVQMERYWCDVLPEEPIATTSTRNTDAESFLLPLDNNSNQDAIDDDESVTRTFLASYSSNARWKWVYLSTPPFGHDQVFVREHPWAMTGVSVVVFLLPVSVVTYGLAMAVGETLDLTPMHASLLLVGGMCPYWHLIAVAALASTHAREGGNGWEMMMRVFKSNLVVAAFGLGVPWFLDVRPWEASSRYTSGRVLEYTIFVMLALLLFLLTSVVARSSSCLGRQPGVGLGDMVMYVFVALFLATVFNSYY